MNTPTQIQLGNPTEQPKKNYFNIHTNGIGRLTRVRTVQPKKGSPFLACTIQAFVGKAGNGIKPKSRFFEVNVAGAKARNLIPQIEQYANNSQYEVYIGFCIGDLWATVYERPDEQQGISTKGRLLHIDWITANNQLLYQDDNSRIPMPDMSNLSQVDNFFELNTTGSGYLSNIRLEATKDQKATFLACNIGALVGEYNDKMKPEYRYFNTRIYDANSEVYKLVYGYQEAVLAGSKVMIGFKVHDIWSKLFTYHKGENAGKPGIAFNSLLVDIGWIKIDGKSAYKKEGDQALPAATTPPVTEEVVLQPSTPAQPPYPQPNARQPLPVTTVQAESTLLAPVAEQVVQQPVIQPVTTQQTQPITQQPAAVSTVQTENIVEQTVQQSIVQGQTTIVQPMVEQPVTVPTVQVQVPEVAVIAEQPVLPPVTPVQVAVVEQAIEPAKAEPAIQVQEPAPETTAEQPVIVEQPSSSNAA